MALALPASTVGEPAAHASAPRFTGERIDLELQDADLDHVLELFSAIGNINIVKQGDVHSGPVTVHLENVPWDEALHGILRSQRLEAVRDGNVLYVCPER